MVHDPESVVVTGFMGFGLGASTPDENTVRLFGNKLTEAGTLKQVMKAFDWQFKKKGYIPMSGQIVDDSVVPAPKQRNTEEEKTAIKAGKSADDILPDEPNKAAQKDTNARWTLQIGGKVRYRPNGTPLPMIAIPTFGYKSHIAIDRRYDFIRESAVMAASDSDGRMLSEVLTTDNTSSDVWANSAYLSKENEAWLSSKNLRSQVHRRNARGKPMSEARSPRQWQAISHLHSG